MKPDIKKFLDIYQYLQEIYAFRKQLNKYFSYTIWSSELGIRNKAYLRLMVIGRRSINENIMTKLIENIELNKEDSEYFVALLGYSQSKNLAEKRVLGARMISLAKRNIDQDAVDPQFEFLSNPLFSKLHALLSFNDIKKAPENLARLMGVEAADIESALDSLRKWNLIEGDGESLKVKSVNFKVQNNFKDLGLHAFYTNLFEDNKRAISLPPEVRRFRSLLFAMNPEEFQAFIDRMNEVASEVLGRHDFSDLENRRLYQFNFSAYPVSLSQDGALELSSF